MEQTTQEPSQRAPRRTGLVALLAAVALLCGFAAIGASYWSMQQTRGEILRLSTELAQLRVSMELYARASAAPDAPDTSAADASAAALADLQSRLEALEENAIAALPELPPAGSSTASLPAVTATGEDCLPPGMRLLVAAGDSYAICGQETAMVDVAEINNGYIGLADGTVIASGGTMPLANSACTVGVTSGGDEALTGYAEIRVNC